MGVLGFLILLWLFGRIGGGGGGSPASALIGTGPPVVVVTVLDPKADEGWTERVKRNREDYARRHGVYSQSWTAALVVMLIEMKRISYFLPKQHTISIA
jgi:hypothetical protein